MRAQIFESLAKTILEGCQDEEILKVHSVSLYQQQDLFQAQALGYRPPCVFIQFLPSTRAQLVGPIQQVTQPITIYLVCEEYSKDQLKSLARSYELLKVLNNSVQPWQFPILATGDTTDYQADSLIINQIGLSTDYYDAAGFEEGTTIGGTSGFNWGMDLSIYMGLEGTQGWCQNYNITP